MEEMASAGDTPYSQERLLKILHLLFIPVALASMALGAPAFIMVIWALEYPGSWLTVILIFTVVMCYIGATILAAIRWSRRPKYTAMVLTLVVIVNTSVLLMDIQIAAAVALAPLYWLDIIGAPRSAPHKVLGAIVFFIVFIILPALDGWLLIRVSKK